MASETPSPTEAQLRRDIDYLERAVLTLAGASAPSARDAYHRAQSQLQRRRKQLRALQASDFGNWPRYPDDPVESAA